MTRTRKLLPLVAVAAALCLYVLPAGPAQPRGVSAADCTAGNTGTLVVNIIDAATNAPLNEGGTNVLIKPAPSNFQLDVIVVDIALQDAHSSQDKDNAPGVIRYEGACSAQGSESYTASLWSLPSDLADCKINTNTAQTQLSAGGTAEMTLEVDCTGVGATPTPTATATAGPAATVVANTSPLSVSCSGTSVISVQVHDAAGNPVQTGTAVTITTTLGSVSPTSGFVTGSAGSVFAFFTAPASSGGVAVITAMAGSASGTATVSVNCGGVSANSTIAPPPTVITGGFIQPPNTGDGGLVAQDGGQPAWVFVGLSLLIAGALFGLSGLWGKSGA